MKINILDKAVAELIAAGEVVERPASIVKELVENAIDAGATDVTVEIRGGGVRYIRVSDNGGGIDKDDIPRAFVRHATSKVRSAEDLDGILTLGFRGEALASIAAMCKVELTTKTENDDSGTTYKIEGGEFVDMSPAGCPTGTTITVRDVFFNTPARMKFLKKDIGEGNAVAQVMDKCALSHPEIAVRFIRDGQIKLRTSGNGDLKAVLMAVYGGELAASMTEVGYMLDGGVKVSGFVSKPEAARPSRAYQNFFINGRYVRTRTASAALEEAFKGKILAGKHPACALNIEIMAEFVDVNVHPAKIEVRFNDERPVFSAVYYAVKSALESAVAPLAGTLSEQRPKTAVNELTLHLPKDEYAQQRLTVQQFKALFEAKDPAEPARFTSPQRLNSSSLDIYVEDDFNEAAKIKRQAVPESDKKSVRDDANILQRDVFGAVKAIKNATISKDPAAPIPANTSEHRDEAGEYRLIGELFGCYILLEQVQPEQIRSKQGESLALVDKHAAHERILYERLIREVSYGSRQILLTPVSVTLSKDEYGAVAENPEAFEQLGFLVEDFGDGTVLVREIPIELGDADIVQIISEVASRLLKGNMELTPGTLDRLYYSIACKSAIRSGDRNSREELAEIIKKLEQNPQITHCPHGRPVLTRISRYEIEKMFGRQT